MSWHGADLLAGSGKALWGGVMGSMDMLMLGCGLVLAGLTAENVAARRWLAAGRPARLDALTVLAFTLPAAGLGVMATVST